MTREEAILCLKGMKNYARDTFTEQTDWQTSIEMAIKALEQETASKESYDHEYFLRKELETKMAGIYRQLDKIRAEIMDTGAYEQEVKGKTEFLEGVNYCLAVIDKYKVESERSEK